MKGLAGGSVVVAGKVGMEKNEKQAKQLHFVGGGCRQGRNGKKRKASKAIALPLWWI